MDQKPCYSVNEVIVLLVECCGWELCLLRSVLVDDYKKGRYTLKDFSNMWILVERKIRTGRLVR
jgi:hypothetical protein